MDLGKGEGVEDMYKILLCRFVRHSKCSMEFPSIHFSGGGACEPQQIPQDMVNERAVCILLECILVSKNLSHFKINKNAFQ